MRIEGEIARWLERASLALGRLDGPLALRVTWPTADKAMQTLVRLGIIREVPGRMRDRIYFYAPYLKVLGEGTEMNGK